MSQGRAAGLLAFALLGTSVVMPTLVGLLAVDLTTDLGFGDSGLGLVVSAFTAQPVARERQAPRLAAAQSALP